MVGELTDGHSPSNKLATRLVIPVFRNLFFGPKKPFLTGFLRIFFFSAFSRGFFHRNVVLEGVAGIPVFFCFYRIFFTGIPAGQKFLYLPRNPPDSGGFLIPPKAAGSGQRLKEGSLLSKIWTKIDLFNLSPEQDLTMVSAAPVLCWRLLA